MTVLFRKVAFRGFLVATCAETRSIEGLDGMLAEAGGVWEALLDASRYSNRYNLRLCEPVSPTADFFVSEVIKRETNYRLSHLGYGE